MLDRYVQPPDVGIHADFQERMDTGLRLEKKLLLTAKAQLNPPNTKIIAHEWREMIVKVGCTVYYDQITEALVQSAWARAGFSDDPTRTASHYRPASRCFPTRSCLRTPKKAMDSRLSGLELSALYICRIPSTRVNPSACAEDGSPGQRSEARVLN